MKYVFLTNSIGGYSGGPNYIRRKLLFLRDNGWTVLVFDCTGFGNIEIQIEELKEFEKNRFKELFFNPYWIRKARREKVIAAILDEIGVDDEVVIESNTVALSIWGEIIASRVGAKHIVYLLSERLSITHSSLYQYYKYKSIRGELFSISPKAYKNLMERFENICDEDAEQHYWSAAISVPIEDVPCREMDNISKAVFNIGHFGREKGYFRYMFEQLSIFAKRHLSESINVIMLGVSDVPVAWRNLLPDNVNLTLLASRQPIPKIFYNHCDVIIATAGCANMSFRYGAKVISMDVYNSVPLGVLGYDTRDRNLRSNNNHYNMSLEETLEKVLVNREYECHPKLEIPYSGKGLKYQVTFLAKADKNYYNVRNIEMTNRKAYSLATRVLLYFNMIDLCTKIRYKKAGKNKH